MKKLQFYMFCNSFAHIHTFLEVLKKGLLLLPFIEKKLEITSQKNSVLYDCFTKLY